MEVCIKGAAETVKLGDIDEVCVEIGRILVPTDGSEPSVAATEYAVALAKTFGAVVKAIYVDTGMEALEYPEEVMSEDVYEGVHPSIKGLALAKALCERNGVDLRGRDRPGGRRQAHRRDGRGVEGRHDRARRYRAEPGSSASLSAVWPRPSSRARRLPSWS